MNTRPISTRDKIILIVGVIYLTVVTSWKSLSAEEAVPVFTGSIVETSHLTAPGEGVEKISGAGEFDNECLLRLRI